MPNEDGIRSKMSLHSYDKPTEKINVFIKKCKNLVCPKAEGMTIYAKVDFNETPVAESQKILVNNEEAPDLNFNFTLNVNSLDQNSLDDIANKPLIVTLIEVLPKEKKQKEEKVLTYGQAVIDLLELIKGKTDISVKSTVYPTPGSTLEAQSSDIPLPELDIRITPEHALISDDDLAKSNLITITFDSMYSLPESWVTSANKDFAYTASLPLPISEDRENPIVFLNGIQKSPTDSTSGKQMKRWSDTRGIQAANAIFIPHSSLAEESNNDEEWGDFQSKEDKEHRVTSEKEKPKVLWGCERRCFLNQASNNALRDQVLRSRYLPIEVIRSAIPTGVKGKRDEDLNMSYHGVVYIDIQPLLYPGATHIRGAYKIQPFVENEYISKTKRKTGIADETLKIVSSLYDRNFAASPIKKDAKAGDKKDVRKPRESNFDGNFDMQSVQQIIDSKSFVVIDIKFDKPIIPRKPFELLANKVSELIPPRPKFPYKANSAERAVQDFHSQLKNIVNLVADDYRNMTLNKNDLQNDEAKRENEFEIKRRKLLYELNSTGKYFAFKEQLKNSVIKIVREKYLKTSSFDDAEEFQKFLSELYVFLIDEMHRFLNDYLAVEDEPVVDLPLTDIQQLKHFAVEAEMNQNYDLSGYYYQERIARDKDNFSNWLDYAVYNLLLEDYTRCEECLKECISIDPKNINSLLLYSVICAMQEKLDIAETFLERVTAQENENVIAWTLYSMLYEQKGQELNADITLKKVMKMNHAQFVELQNSYIQFAQTTHGTLELEESSSTARKEEDMMDELKFDSSKSRNSKRGTLTQQGKIKLDGSSKSGLGGAHKVEESHLSVKDRQTSAELAVNKSIYMRTANFLIKHNAFAWAEKCMAKELLSPTGGPSCLYNILLAKIKLSRNELNEAEKYCVEALQFDYQNCEAWILWSHIRYLAGDYKGAKERYERVLLFPELPNEQKHSVYIRLASIYLKEEDFENAKKLFLYPCKNSPSCMSWLGVGICCYRLEQLEEAKIALSEANILNNRAPEVWAYLSLICLRTNKRLEAEQAYKYAVKLDLDNPELLVEIHNLQQEVGFGNPEF